MGEKKIIGADPWNDPRTARPSESTGFPAWRDNRDIVGNPEYDLVSWVETTDDDTRGALVVVEASTGDVLARTSLDVPAGDVVVLASVDDGMVFFATPDPTTGFPDVPGADIGFWAWSTDTPPTTQEPGRYYNDVSGGIWAVYGNGVEFDDETGRTMTTFPFFDDKPTDFGNALSPDGRYWYGAETSEIVETATGNAVQIAAARERGYAWTATNELTLSGPTMVCSAVTGQCRGPAGIQPNHLCAPYGIDCGANLPVY
ncbi:hypothetical protein IWX78_002304 [Mycetocola sp. CAN_C7]|uniref:hypothetical protein n=1 Tax=Mycetocola sp. CAN_C7 TaxID=2787724 RepID=UPI0018C8FD6D